MAPFVDEICTPNSSFIVSARYPLINERTFSSQDTNNSINCNF